MFREWFQTWGGPPSATGPGSGNRGHKGIPGRRGGSAPGGGGVIAAISNTAYQSIQDNGGVTINMAGDQPTEGYAYSPYKDSEDVSPSRGFTREQVRAFIQKNKKRLGQPGHYIGGRVDDGKVYMDVSIIGTPTESTLKEAERLQQEGVFDLKSGETIYTSLGGGGT